MSSNTPILGHGVSPDMEGVGEDDLFLDEDLGGDFSHFL